MKKIFGYILFTLIVVSCSTPDGTFRLKGKFKNFNQGELYVYSLTGKARIDTIKLVEGSYKYEVPMEDTVLLSVVFPNYSEIPVIAAPGTEVTMQGDASHLREVRVEGTDENSLLTQFRLEANELTPPEADKAAAKFISDNPESPASLYVLNKYFLLKADAPFDKTYKLLSAMQKATPDSKLIARLQKQVGTQNKVKTGDRLPAFSAATITGGKVSNADLKGELNVITLWATWNYESQNMQRQLQRQKKKYGQRLQLLSISLDGNPAECKQTSTRDSLAWPIVCDGRMWESSIVSALGFHAIPDVIIADKSGRIIARRLTSNMLNEEIDKRLASK